MRVGLGVGRHANLLESLVRPGTALSSTFIDDSKLRSKSARRTKLTAEKGTLEARIDELDALLSGRPTAAQTATLTAELSQKASRLAVVKDELAELPTPGPRATRSLLEDLVSDATGVSLHRFQILSWTIILGFIFVTRVWHELEMPVFDNTLLALMGISSGTYLGFKFPEQKHPEEGD